MGDLTQCNYCRWEQLRRAEPDLQLVRGGELEPPSFLGWMVVVKPDERGKYLLDGRAVGLCAAFQVLTHDCVC